MLTDVISLYPSTVRNSVRVTSGYAPHDLVVIGKGKIRMRFINPYYNSSIDMFMAVVTKVMLNRMYGVLFYGGETLWQERRL